MGQEETVEKVISELSEKEKIELASVILKDLNKKNSKKKNSANDPFFSEELTDELEW